MPRIAVNVTQAIFLAIQELKAKRGTEMTDVIRDGVALLKFFEDALAEDSIIVIRHKNGREESFRLADR